MTDLDVATKQEAGADLERGPIRCTCHFFNQTGTKIHVTLLRHTIDDNETVLLKDRDLANAESVKCKDILSYSQVPVNDYWHVEFEADGHSYTNSSFYCNLTKNDDGGDVVVRVDLSHLHLDPPKSSGCQKKLNKQ